MSNETPLRFGHVKTVLCVGAGVIGGGWAAFFLARGYRVIAWDPGSGAERSLRQFVDAAWPALTELGLAPGASRGNLEFETRLEIACAQADFVQESAPESLDLKQTLLADIDRHTAEHVVIASSTSGFPMSDMQTLGENPGRMVVGHPFNPVYLIPLVEVAGGRLSDQSAVDWAADFYTHVGKSVIKLDREVYGFVANRLQEAIWRESLHMISAGEATVEQIDRAISDGPGLRWPVIGPVMTLHLAAGRGGIARYLDEFGALLRAPYTRLEAPPLTEELRDLVIDGCAEEVGDRGFDDLVRERDRLILAVRRAVER